MKSSEDLKSGVIRILEDYKASDIREYDISERTALADWFVIATGEADRHIEALLDGVVHGSGPVVRTRDSVDALLLNRVWGSLIFFAVMYVVFQSLYAWAGPVMDLIQFGTSWVQGLVTPWLAGTPVLLSLVQGLAQQEELAARDLDLLKRAERFRGLLRDRGLDTLQSESHILPLRVGDNARALHLAARLRERGIFVVAIRPPTVPPGTARLRLSVTLAHTDAQLAAAADIIHRAFEEFPAA